MTDYPDGWHDVPRDTLAAMRGRVARGAAAAVALALLAAGLWWVLRTPAPPPASSVAPLTLPFVAPSYVALGADGLLVRSGTERHVVGGRSARWLAVGERGTVLLSRADDGTRQVVVDPATGGWGTEVATEGSPVGAVDQVDVVRSVGSPEVEALAVGPAPDLTPRWRVELPLGRTWGHGAVTAGGTTYVPWADGTRAGWWRIGPDRAGIDVLVGERVVDLRPSADGAALLGIREPEPPTCPGCVAPQRVVEVDPATGEVVADYAVPEPYDPSWRVTALDKVGRRVAVRFVSTSYVDGPDGTLVPVRAEEGTWVFDGEWSLLPGSRTEQTWWQGPDDRVVARAAPDEPAWKDGVQLVWLHGDDPPVPLPGELSTPGARDVLVGSVPGQLLPPR